MVRSPLSIYGVISAAMAAAVLVLPGTAGAQAAVAGTITDASRQVLPGVSVEVSGPALIEGRRTAVTDSDGRYNLVDLRPGTYSVEFSRAGFSTVRRDGIVLSGDFTASVDVVLQITAQEVVLVQAPSPVVDTRVALVQHVMNRELIDAIPTGRSYQAIGQLAPSITVSRPDIGGTENFFTTHLRAHGSLPSDQAIHLDGMDTTDGEGDGRYQGFYRDAGDNDEVVYTTSALPAEVSKGGVRINMIGRTGSNEFRGDLFISETPGLWQSSNLADDLTRRGFASASEIRRIFDYNATAGGPIRRDRMWFFTSWRMWAIYKNAAGQLLPSGSPAHDDAEHVAGSLRLTTRLSTRNRLMLYYGRMFRRTLYNRNISPAVTPDASLLHTTPLLHSAQAQWTSYLSDEWLFQAGVSTTYAHPVLSPQPEVVADPMRIAKQDLILATSWNAAPGGLNTLYKGRRGYEASLAYVTGAHRFKTGVQLGEARSRNTISLNGDLVQEYRDGVPSSVTVRNTPVDQQVHLFPDLGVFVQDTWTVRRLSISPGLRWEFFRARVDERTVGAGRFVGARHFDAIENLPDWKTWAPRFGVVYDLFGDGTSALKASVNKYMVGESVAFTERYNPMVVAGDRRSWNDVNGNDIAEDSEIGPPNVANFGTRQNRYPDPHIRRPYQVESNVSFQHELLPRGSVTVGYFRRSYHELFTSDNILIGPEDYTPMVIDSPLDGQAITIYNLSPLKRTAFEVVDRNSSTNTRTYNGVDFTGVARFARGMLFGGVTIGKEAQRTCDVDDPNQLRYCDQTKFVPYQMLFKLSGSYALPYGVHGSATFQSTPGYPREVPGGGDRAQPEAGLRVDYLVNASIARGLTQPQITVNLIPPGSRYLPRLNQLDVRLGRRFKTATVEWDVNLDVFNVLNSSAVLRQIETWGPNLDRPLEVVQGRLFRVNLQARF